MIPEKIHYIGFLFLCSTWMHVVRLLFMWPHTQRHEHPHRYVCAAVSRSPNFWLASLASSIICWGSWQSVSMAESFADPLVVTASVRRCRGERTASDLLRSFRTLATCHLDSFLGYIYYSWNILLFVNVVFLQGCLGYFSNQCKPKPADEQTIWFSMILARFWSRTRVLSGNPEIRERCLHHSQLKVMHKVSQCKWWRRALDLPRPFSSPSVKCLSKNRWWYPKSKRCMSQKQWGNSMYKGQGM